MTTLVLLPGMDGTGELFAPLLAPMAAALGPQSDVQVLRYPVDQAWGYAELEAWVLPRLPATPLVLLGESFSGPIAIALAARGLTQLRGLVLCCTFVRNPRPALGGLGRLVNVLPVTAAPPRVFDAMLLGRWSTADLRAATARAMAQVSAQALRARLRAVVQVDVSAQLRATRVPVLDLRARHDRLVPPSAARQVRLLAPQAQTADFDAPHFLLQTQPDAAAAAIAGFMCECLTPSA